MNKLSLLYLALYLLCDCAHCDDDPRLELKIYKHQPCTKGSAKEKIRFPDNNEAPLRRDPDKGDGCYTIKGTVRVFQQITGTIQLYVETKYGTKAPTESCQGADDNNCGGAGSCIYCDACHGIRELGKSNVQLIVGNKGLDCKKGLAPRNYTDIYVSFCMPTKQEFLKSQKIDEDFWNRYGSSGQMVFITMYIFNQKVNELPHKQLLKIAVPDGDQVIGCHKLVGSIYEPST
jgi:hypothetical protein